MTATTLTAVPATLFAIVATYQVHENYNLDDPKGAPYWKAKGGHEVVVHEGMGIDALNALSLDEKEALVSATAPESDEYYSYDLIDWEVVTLNQETIDSVREALAKDEFSYARFCFKQSEYAFDWACRQVPDMLEQYRDKWNGWEIDRILRVQTTA